jgi:formamidopyrimidine-DNA glycosylase
MPELPEIASRAREMNTSLVGKTIQSVEVKQPKCLNLPEDEFQSMINGKTIREITYHGKWLFCHLSDGWLLINLGMGGEILLVTRDTLPEKYRVVIDFDDHTCLSINFWWFGYVHYLEEGRLHEHNMTSKLGPNAIEVSRLEFQKLIQGTRTRVKKFLLDQSKIAGIGNAYIHDILFMAKIHPMRTLDSLTPAEIDRLYAAIQNGLLPSLEKNGAFYELDLHGNKGLFSMQDILIGYKENQPCPDCTTPIKKIKTGSTSSFICPQCQGFI